MSPPHGIGFILPKSDHTPGMDATSSLDDTSLATDASAAWTAECVSALMSRHGVSPRHQAAEIAQICAISVSQARRKLRGAVWLFGEVLALCRHFGESLDAVFARSAIHGGGPSSAPHHEAHGGQPAHLLVDDLHLACHIHLGSQCAVTAATGQELLATRQGDGWVAGSAARIRQLPSGGPCYRIDHLQLDAADDHPRMNIAVLDDDLCAAHALVDWFQEMGFDAQPFTDSTSLLRAVHERAGFDAYVVDLILSGGQTSQSVVERIRQDQPHSPIVLLTGQLRDGTASEATLATMLRTQNVTFFEKPVRPAVLTAAIQSGLDRRPLDA